MKIMAIRAESTTYTELFPARQSFLDLASSLRLLVPAPELALVKDILSNYMPQRVKRILPRLSQPENVDQWLSLILKTNFLVHLRSLDEQQVVVGLNVSGSYETAQTQLEIIKSEEFRAARKALDISQHWFVIIPGLPPQVPTRDELIDALYSLLDESTECGIIQFGN